MPIYPSFLFRLDCRCLMRTLLIIDDLDPHRDTVVIPNIGVEQMVALIAALSRAAK